MVFPLKRHLPGVFKANSSGMLVTAGNSHLGLLKLRDFPKLVQLQCLYVLF